jgi:hypothetical protein
MDVVKATARYEDWLRTHTSLIEGDLRLKHTKMAESVFSLSPAVFHGLGEGKHAPRKS